MDRLVPLLVVAAAALALALVAPTVRAASSPAASPSLAEPTAPRTLVRHLVREHFGRVRVRGIREAGLARIRATTDPAVLEAMVDILADEDDEVRGVLLNHLQTQGETGEVLLMLAALTADDRRFGGAALMRLPGGTDLSPSALRVLRSGLRSPRPILVDRSAELAAWLGLTELMPDLIASLSVTVERREVRATLPRRIGLTLAGYVGTDGLVGRPDLVSLHGTSFGRRTQRSDERRRVARSPRPAVHRALLVLAHRTHGPRTRDHGFDQIAWRTWLDDVATMGPPAPSGP